MASDVIDTEMIEYRTPSGRIAPHPNMTDDDLDEFEAWAKEVEKGLEQNIKVYKTIVVIGICVIILILLL